MTEILESSANSLKIIYRRSWVNRITYLALAVMLFSVDVFIFFGKLNSEAHAERSAFAPTGLLLMEISMLAFGLFFLASSFDATEYFFDRIADRFYLTGRRNFIRKWSVEGAISDITDVLYEIYGNDEDHSSEIYLKYNHSGSSPETLKCGTGEKFEDEIIASRIKTFLELEKIIL